VRPDEFFNPAPFSENPSRSSCFGIDRDICFDFIVKTFYLSVIGLPRPDFLFGPPKTSGGKKSLPQERRFTLPYLCAAGVNLIMRDSIPDNTPYTISIIYNRRMKMKIK
jgi:hypothetical protein